MAVADLGLALGPRARRRATKGAIALAVIVAGAAALFLTHPGGHSASVASTPNTSTRALPSAPKVHPLAFGMNKEQIRRLVGQPTSIRGSCWLYSSKPLGLVQTYFTSGPQLVPIKVCFLDNQVEGLYSWAVGGRKHKGGWIPPLIDSSARNG